jgi:regulator of replication initiation timing
MQSKVDQLVDDAKTFLEIIESYCRQSLTDCVPMLKKINELIDEVSILETERQRLVQENAKLKKDVEAAPGEVIRLAKENEQLLKRIDYLKEWNNNQANIIQSIEKRYFTDGSHDYAHTYEDLQTGMKYVEIRSGLLQEDQGYDYALKA